ncbi:hypothetical protein SDRG_03749 [Saprolegnia diclina VS20]|uniref:Uncharacterized protein n=1 Tax=Saprolegnia diclina (strain VS20) TaxID=1156394 RepID=T0QXJ2_SAPDV|nr:hypothetical protein SDRG_03749 [Saprolegnia diclina VS20]EQC38790.1 hypothetical protein SDRG_03749 [Saprolegnia diclina VS20]|eukprot:XP_008607614.1 hypothetical protein SDRG_03749 [Saprolegnia diclina VS20]
MESYTEPLDVSMMAPLPQLVHTPIDVDISCLSLHGPPLAQPEAEPLLSPSHALPTVLPATFLRTICDQLEFYFCDDNLLGDLFLLKNMNAHGYVKLELLATFGRVKKLTTDIALLQQALELSTKLLLSEEGASVCRKDPLPYDQTYHGKLSRTAIAYNLAEDASIASLKDTFRTCGEITYLRLLKKNGATGRNAVLKPPVISGETYAIIEFIDAEMANHAVLTLSDQYNWRTGMQVVLFDGTTTDKLKQRMFPVEVDRRRAKSAAAAFQSTNGGGSNSASSSPRAGNKSAPIHVESVGEGLNDLSEGKVSTGVVYSIRGAGGLITPARQDGSSISFRLVPDEDGSIDIFQGDYVSFTVGKNKKSGRKYASKVKLEYRPPSVHAAATAPPTRHENHHTSMANGERSRARTMGNDAATPFTRGRSSSSGQRPQRLPLKSPDAVDSAIAQAFRQAAGPDGTRGFGRARGPLPAKKEPGLSASFAADLAGRRRAASSGAPPPPSFFGSGNGFAF